MKLTPIVILYATREGHTATVVERLAAALRDLRLSVDIANVAEPSPPDLARYAGAILAASIHTGRHEREMVAYVRSHRAALERMPSAFLSVSLSEAGAEDEHAAEELRSKAAEDVRWMIETFCNETGWHPRQVVPVAGALMYTRYNVLVRFLMRMIARRAGASTDTSHDHVFTDWTALDRFAEAFAASVTAPSPAVTAP